MRVEFLGCPVDILTMSETIDRAREAMRGRTRLQHVALNVAKLVNMRSDLVLADDVRSSDLVGVDGMGIVWAARSLGIPIKERVAGIDLFDKLLEVCAAEGFKPFFLGATPEVVDRAAKQAVNRHPTICFAGLRDGYFKPAQEREVGNQIRDSGADCLFIGMPTPRKERFLAAYRDQLNVPFIMGVGGSFDILAGQVQRAPQIMQSLGLEWLYRIYQEPRRMWWRYAKTNTVFAGIMLQEVVRHRWTTKHHPLRRAPTEPHDR
jgi:N-acetylglucosaminyldiphosphoundecaprenol N-acetyl-beta-D-mannosaminyltransferase